MKLIAFTLVSSLLLSHTVLASSIKEEDLNGRWQCAHQFSEANQNMLIKVDYTIHLMKDKTSVGSGDLLLTMDGLPPLAYKENDKGHWQLKGNRLTLESTDIQFVNTSHPEFESVLNFQQLFPKKVKETVEVLSVSAQQLTVALPNRNGTYHCYKT